MRRREVLTASAGVFGMGALGATVGVGTVTAKAEIDKLELVRRLDFGDVMRQGEYIRAVTIHEGYLLVATTITVHIFKWRGTVPGG